LDQLSKWIPESQGSVIVDIADLDRNREWLVKQKAVYDTARYAFGRSYPILLSSGYRLGSLADALPEELAKLVGEPIDEILENKSGCGARSPRTTSRSGTWPMSCVSRRNGWA
jgi:hypothetical protein